MITEAQLESQVREIFPDWFGKDRDTKAASSLMTEWVEARAGTPERTILDIWTLPAGRILFSATENEYECGLHLLDVGQRRLRVLLYVGEGRPDSSVVRQRVLDAVIGWMQGLRSENLEAIDKGVLGWLGEMAYRMTPTQLAIVETVALSLPSSDWGDYTDPIRHADDYLSQVLSDLGFSDDYISEHLG